MPAVPDVWLVVGTGRCGLQLARTMAAAHLKLAGVVCRGDRGRARVRRTLPGVAAVAPAAELPAATAVLIAVPDDALGECAVALARRRPPGLRIALHTSGLHSAASLAPLGEHGVATGSFHPLATFAAAGGLLVPLAGALAAVEGQETAVRAGLRLARALGMVGRRLSADDKPRYHAAAAIAANLTHVLVVEARSLMQAAGFDRREASRALRPLIHAATAAALAARGIERLTGPIARGDGATVRAHLGVLDPRLAAAYRAVAALAVVRLRAAASRDVVAKSALDSVLRSLTATDRCGSLPADERD